jgi:hypothetical protein
MRLRIAQFFLNMIDDFLSMTLQGRGYLALYLEQLQTAHLKKSPMARRIAREMGVPVIELRLAECPVEDITGLPRRL